MVAFPGFGVHQIAGAIVERVYSSLVGAPSDEPEQRVAARRDPYQVIEDKKATLEDQMRHYFEPIKGVLLFYSEKGDPSVNLNCKIDHLVCSHYASFVSRRNMENYHEALQSEESVRQEQELMDTRYDLNKEIYQARNYSLFGIEELGNQLHKIARTLGEGQSCILNFTTEGHRMVVKIERIDEAFGVHVYDPNQTNVDISILCQDLHIVQSFSINFISTFRDSMTYHFRSQRQLEAVGLFSKEQYQLHLREMNPSHLAINLRGLGTWGQYFSKFKVACLSSVEQRPITQKPYIKVECEDQEARLLFSLNFGWADETLDATENILDQAESSDETTKKLSVQGEFGASGLFMALQENHYDAVRKFVSKIVNSEKLTFEQKEIILLAERQDKITGLSMALQRENREAVEAYINEILNSKNLTFKQKEKLLLLNSKSLFHSMEERHTEAVKIYYHTIIDSDLPLDIQRSLLFAYTNNSILSLALKSGWTSAIQIYAQVILGTKFSFGRKEEILTAKDEQGNPGLFLALLQGHFSSVETFIRIVLQSNLDFSQKKRLIEARGEQDVPAVYKAHQRGDARAVRVYYEAIRKYATTDAERGIGTSPISGPEKALKYAT